MRGEIQFDRWLLLPGVVAGIVVGVMAYIESYSLPGAIMGVIIGAGTAAVFSALLAAILTPVAWFIVARSEGESGRKAILQAAAKTIGWLAVLALYFVFNQAISAVIGLAPVWAQSILKLGFFFFILLMIVVSADEAVAARRHRSPVFSVGKSRSLVKK